jgi:hypothetical protein
MTCLKRSPRRAYSEEECGVERNYNDVSVYKWGSKKTWGAREGCKEMRSTSAVVCRAGPPDEHIQNLKGTPSHSHPSLRSIYSHQAVGTRALEGALVSWKESLAVCWENDKYP